MDRKQLLSSKEYWLSKIQIDLFNQVSSYLENNNIKRSELAKKLGVTKGYISQILKGDSDHRISKMVELSLAIGLIPDIRFRNLEEYLRTDEKCKNKDEQEFMESVQAIYKRGYMPYKKRGLYTDNLRDLDYSEETTSSLSA
ncbi:MAG: helix-turn-helix transcriptional regulator [Proteiniphilum sp.]|jgi:transcriptional regulator with XRE-family HTH domain|nr:helix-turn-helix transcriptional regulator [Proteiniphilum sp.]MDD3555952.1 helix-turn-helix transcriptional regulator [Proteiniphilum sp.]MDY0182626.1 helix-turn-helix transcriptional regulator [Proteiniphilum sp.]